EQASLQRQLPGQRWLARRVDRRQCAIGSLVPQIDGREVDRDRSLAYSAHAVVDLILQKLTCRLQQVEGDKSLGELADHGVAVCADRHQVVVELVKERHRLNGIEPVRLAVEE